MGVGGGVSWPVMPAKPKPEQVKTWADQLTRTLNTTITNVSKPVSGKKSNGTIDPYTMTNSVKLRQFNTASGTTTQLAELTATLIQDLKNAGHLQ